MREGDPINAVTPVNRSNLQDDNTRFTAVNNASNGNAATVVVGHNRVALGPIAASPRTAARPLEDWQDNSTDHPQKRKRTPDPTPGLHHPNPYPQLHVQQNPQTPRQQPAHPPQLQTTGSDSGAVIEELTNTKHHSMDVSYSEQGKVGEPKHGELRELRMVEGSPQTPTHEGSEQKKRKRQFANRTKTGCITCRRRKKKCDEGKPECTNCKRGGFVCEGYTNKIAWPKAPVKNTPPVSIQSKDANPSASTSPSPTAAPSVISTSGHLLLTGEQHSASTHSPQQRPANIDRSYVTSTPPPGGQPHPVRQTPVPQQQPQEFLPRTPTFVSSGPLLPSPRNASPGPSGGFGNGEMTEKQKMLSGQLYYGSSPELIAERDRCKQSCYRFNNASMLNASKAEQWRLFVETLRPGGQYKGMPQGIIDKVDVETPFYCNYGTNISLGEEVRIGPGCTIIDAALVTIKARTILDGDVKIYTTIRRQDPRKRMGTKGPESAKPVVIEEDCWIGGNVTVLPGVTIGRGAVVGAGSVVCQDVPPYTVAAGNPSSILSGVYNNGSGM